MRRTQYCGLPLVALAFLRHSCASIPVQTCPHCHEVLFEGFDKWVYASAAHEGMFGDGPDLYEYRLTNGSKVRETVQTVPWSSGPCIFLQLVDEQGKPLFVWPDEEIDKLV